jgi:hypothetical protein
VAFLAQKFTSAELYAWMSGGLGEALSTYGKIRAKLEQSLPMFMTNW